MSSASSAHPDIGPELRQLAQAMLDRLDPAVRAAAAAAGEALREPGSCQQVWCPVCAVVALVNGEQHPLLGLIAEHSVSLLTVIRTMAADPADRGDAPPADDTATPDDADDTPPPTRNGRYHQIPIVVEPTVQAPPGVPAETVGDRSGPADSGVEPAPDAVTVGPDAS